MHRKSLFLLCIYLAVIVVGFITAELPPNSCLLIDLIKKNQYFAYICSFIFNKVMSGHNFKPVATSTSKLYLLLRIITMFLTCSS